MLIHGGLSKKETVILYTIGVVTLPIWLPAWGVYRIVKKVKGK